MAGIPLPALLLGVGGLVPFAGLVLLALLPNWTAEALFAQRAYGACILSFVGAVHWGFAVARGTLSWTQTGWSVLPALIAWVALTLGAAGTWLLIAGLALAWAVDHYAAIGRSFPPWYRRLRTVLTSGAILSLAGGMALA
jgi:hypothetical protein